MVNWLGYRQTNWRSQRTGLLRSSAQRIELIALLVKENKWEDPFSYLPDESWKQMVEDKGTNLDHFITETFI